MAFREIAGEAEAADGDALEGEDVVVGGGEHSANLVIAALVKCDESFFFSEDFEFCGQEGLGFAFEEKVAGCENVALSPIENAIECGVIDF